MKTLTELATEALVAQRQCGLLAAADPDGWRPAMAERDRSRAELMGALQDRRCATCRHAEYDRKARTVVALWAAGASLKAIQAEMGWTRGMVAGMFHLYREDGYDLPYRYRQGTRNATRFPDQRKVAA